MSRAVKTYAEGRAVGRRQNRMHEESVPHLDHNCTGRIWWDYFGTLGATEGLQFPREVLVSNLQLILVSVSSYHHRRSPSSIPSHVVGSCAHGPGVACTQHEGARWGKRPCPPNIGDLCSDRWWLLLIPEVETKGRQLLLLDLIPFVVCSPPLAEVPSRRLKGPALLPTLFYSSSLLGSQTLKIGMFKNNCIYREN